MMDELTRRAMEGLRGMIAGRKAQAWQRLMLGDGNKPTRDAEIVLGDLRRFCRAQSSTFDPDPYISARLQGRRDAWLRIAEFLNLSEAQVRQLVEVEDEVL